MIELGTDNFIQVLGVVATAIIVTLMAIQKIVREWRSTEAETRIITLMHIELERMSEQNTALSTELGRLHAEVINLNQQLQQLTIENQCLQREIIALTNEVNNLKMLREKAK